MNLFPYQVEGARFLAEKKRALLADDMGLGKTAQAIAACDLVDAGMFNVLVVCPASVRETWHREFRRFAGDKYQAVVLSYDRIAKGTYKSSVPVHIDVLILDEAHYLKSRTAKRTKAIFGPKCDGVGGLVERAKHVFLLTGTPTPNNPSELWPMLRAVMPDAIGPEGMSARGGWPGTETTVSVACGKPFSYWQYINRYCYLRDNGFGTEIVKGRNLDELRARIAPYVLRRKKADVMKDLPPIRFDQIYLEGDLTLPVEVLAEVENVEWALANGGIKALAKLAPHVATLRRLTGLAKVKPAVEWIRDWLEAGGKKLVVFAHHRKVIEGLAVGLAQNLCCVTGATPADERQDIVNLFQSRYGPRIFIGQIQAAGVGITLHAASDVLFVESSWVPADNEQAAMRIHRIGQKNACLVRFATLAGSIDERIQRAVMRKTADVAKLFN